MQQQGVIPNISPHCSVSATSNSTENTQNPRTSHLSTIFDFGREFVRSMDPRYSYHKQDHDCGFKLDFQPREFAKSVISIVSPTANALIRGVDFVNNNKLLAVPVAMVAHIIGTGANPVSQGKIAIKDAATLQQIGKELPINGDYIQTNPIHINGTEFQPIGTTDQPFLGTYDGNGEPISGLTDCLFEKVSCDSSVKNVAITDSEVNIAPGDVDKHRGFVACEAEESASLTNNRLANSTIVTHKKRWGRHPEKGLGGIVGQASGGVRISGSQVDHCKIEAVRKEQTGLVAGIATGDSVISGSKVSGSSVLVKGEDSRASAVVGKASGNVKIESSTLAEITLESSGEGLNAAGVVGYATGNTEVGHTVASKVRVITHYSSADAGVVVGAADERVKVFDSNVDGSSVSTSGRYADAGITAGQATGSVRLTNTTATGCTAVTHRTDGRGYESYNANVGIGLGYGSGNVIVNGTFAESCIVSSNGKVNYAGNAAIGVGRAKENVQIIDTHAVNCTVSTKSARSMGGGGAGKIEGRVQVVNTVTDHLVVSASGEHSQVGFGVGKASGSTSIKRTNATDSDLISNANSGDIGGGAGLLRDNARVDLTTLMNCNILALGSESDAGGGAGNIGDKAQVDKTVVDFSNITTTASDSDAGFAVGQAFGDASITSTRVNNSIAQSYGANANAGGVGELKNKAVLQNTQVYGSAIIAKGENAHTAVGAGFAEKRSRVDGVLSRDNRIITSGKSSHAAVGVGKLSESAKAGNIQAFCSHVEAKGELASAGVGTGMLGDSAELSNIHACGGSVSVRESSYGNANVAAGIAAGGSIANVTACDIQINGKLDNKHCEATSCTDTCLPSATPNPVLQTSQHTTFPSTARPQVLTPNTSPKPTLSPQAVSPDTTPKPALLPQVVSPDTSPKPALSPQGAQTSTSKLMIGENQTVNYSIPDRQARNSMPSDIKEAQTETLSTAGALSLGGLGGITIGGVVVYSAVNVVRGIKEGKTGWDLAKAPFSYAVNDFRSFTRPRPTDADQFELSSTAPLVQGMEEDIA
ncbi:hypothetical protein [Endozoicomonas atrinae]|uniref:hypothetical protein n=1 Tax=Endozoicomonas atrinae TaxID=1333660 RepID=UPI000AED3F9F|nr:hypothetical protein [Endozoicomonas atrinae]